MSDGRGGFVPVETTALEALEGSLAEVREAEARLRAATDALNELSEDLKIDAVRRLRERGASEAQVERYEASHREGTARVRREAAAFDEHLAALEEAVRAVCG